LCLDFFKRSCSVPARPWLLLHKTTSSDREPRLRGTKCNISEVLSRHVICDWKQELEGISK
jgi:UDP-N-acetyl-D-mannosaminuronate dehydrogenase